MSILLILVLVLAAVTSTVSKTYLQTSAKTGQFTAAQNAFESLTRRLSQATLNTYLDYEDATNKTDQNYSSSGSSASYQFIPTHYGRQSELRFIAGNLAQTDPNFGVTITPGRPTHAVFFQAPLSTTSTSGLIGLNRLLNVCGYYIEFNKDPEVPSILGVPPPHYRFRLMEMDEPTEHFSLYDDEVTTSPTGNATEYNGHGWFTGPLLGGSDPDSSLSTPASSYVLADNVVALVILPRLAPEDEAQFTGLSPTQQATVLSPNYFYDSTSIGAAANPPAGNSSSSFNPTAAVNSINQLPPVVQVTMVAIDEPSAIRLQAQYGMNSSTIPNALQTALYGNPTLFTNTSSSTYDTDLNTLQTNLTNLKLTYHVFQTNVIIKAAKWSSQQTGL